MQKATDIQFGEVLNSGISEVLTKVNGFAEVSHLQVFNDARIISANITESQYKKKMKEKANIILLAFLAMGFGDVVGSMVSLAKQSFSLSNAVAQLLPFGGFPLIFSITIDAMPERTNELSGLLITAIIGGAFIPFIMGFVQDKTSLLVGFVVPLICLLYVALFHLKY